MNTSIYDFDTQFGPFEAFAPFTPYAPFALFALMSAPAIWWSDAWLGMYGAFSEAMISGMTYPYELPAHGAAANDADRGHAHVPHSAASA